MELRDISIHGVAAVTANFLMLLLSDPHSHWLRLFLRFAFCLLLSDPHSVSLLCLSDANKAESSVDAAWDKLRPFNRILILFPMVVLPCIVSLRTSP